MAVVTEGVGDESAALLALHGVVGESLGGQVGVATCVTCQSPSSATYQFSLGGDVSSRDSVLREALSAGQLLEAQVAEHLALPPATPAFNPVALLAGTVEASPTADDRARTRLAEIVALLEGKAA